MKKFTLALVLIAVSCLGLYAQPQIPNPGFENWVDTETPTSWSGSNIHTTYMGIPINIVTISQDNATPFNGTYSCRMTTQSIGMGFPANPGFITLGTFWFTISPQAGGAKGGILFNGKPDSLKGYYKNTLQGSDKSTIMMEMWQANMTIISRDTMVIASSHAGYTPFSMPLTYYTSGTPDSMNIVICCSDMYNQGNIAANTTLTVDDLSLVYGTVGIEGLNFSKEFNVWADAATETLFIKLSFDTPRTTEISMYNISGQKVYTSVKEIGESLESVSLGSFTPGIYIVDVEAGGRHFTQKISLR